MHRTLAAKFHLQRSPPIPICPYDLSPPVSCAGALVSATISHELRRRSSRLADLVRRLLSPVCHIRVYKRVWCLPRSVFVVYGRLLQFALIQAHSSTDFYVREYLTDYSPGDIGWIGGIQIFLIFTSGIFTGRAFDRGYFHHLMIGGSILHAFSFFMLSLSHKNSYYQVFLSQGLGSGLASGMTYIPSLAVVSHYFQRHRPLAMGVVASGTALGAVVHPIMLNALLHGPIGFVNGVRFSTGFNLGLLIVANIVMRARLPPKPTGSTVPFTEFVRDQPYLFMVIGGLLVMCGLHFPTFFLQLDVVAHGVDRVFAFRCLSILSAASIVGRLLPTFLAPRCGVFNMGILFTLCMGILIFAMVAVKDSASLVVFAVFYGFFSGGAISLTPPMLASLAKDINEIGARIGVAFTFYGIIGLVATPINGLILTSRLHWWRPIVFTGTTTIAGAICFAISRFFLVRRKGTRVV
ncbi:Riboflavin transporter MCH5 [Hypsizygus marmoreus]|uniref:Riboflavin transporter MCH5 n=1 Tax=Hypsizygus marmoreus TaxID=39966 RepID=A0A369J993_HYPMA|nr:Riboflavin transporter MCH5 [Hypsizygus marmoreus]